MNLQEQIKAEIAEQIKKNSIESIILNSEYHVLTFSGTSDFSFLGQSFPNDLVATRRMLIKSIKTFLYAASEIDEIFNDTSAEHFTIPAGARINKVEDRFNRAGQLEIIINGSQRNIFPEDILGAALNGIPPDIFVDNIYYNYKNPIQQLQCRANYQVIQNLDTAALDVNNPFIRVMIECYLY